MKRDTSYRTAAVMEDRVEEIRKEADYREVRLAMFRLENGRLGADEAVEASRLATEVASYYAEEAKYERAINHIPKWAWAVWLCVSAIATLFGSIGFANIFYFTELSEMANIAVGIAAMLISSLVMLAIFMLLLIGACRWRLQRRAHWLQRQACCFDNYMIGTMINNPDR